MSTMPGATVVAQRYHDYMILYTAGEKVEAVVDGAPPGPMGRLFTVETDKPIKVPYEAGRFILEHLAYTGVVRVDEKEGDAGTTWDIEKARAESLVQFQLEDERRWREYVEYCITDKVNAKKAVPATPESIRRLIARRGYRLNDFGITPVGESQPNDNAIAQLTANNKALQEQVKSQGEQLSRLLSLLGEDDGKGKGKGKN